MNKLQASIEEENLKEVEKSQIIGGKRKRGNSTGPNLIYNLVEINGDGDEAEDEDEGGKKEEEKKQPRRSPRKVTKQSPQTKKLSPSRSPARAQSNMKLRKSARNPKISESSELVK